MSHLEVVVPGGRTTWQTAMLTRIAVPGRLDSIEIRDLCESLKNNFGIFMPLVRTHPHLRQERLVGCTEQRHASGFLSRTFRNVLRPARMLPPIHVVYLRSAGAEIRIFISSTASLLISRIKRSGKFLHNVEPPERTMFRYNDLRRSRSVRVMASWTIWCTPGYSRPINSGSKRISGARYRSWPI